MRWVYTQYRQGEETIKDELREIANMQILSPEGKLVMVPKLD